MVYISYCYLFFRDGVGATGVFIALYCLLDDLKQSRKSKINVSHFVTKMRKYRVNMVENEVRMNT